MSAQVHVPSLLARVGTASVLTFAVTTTMMAPGLVNDAEAATAHSTKALKVAASKKGAPYKYGAAGPSRFDCSGLTVYSFKKAGKKLPARHSSSTTRPARSRSRSGSRATSSSSTPAGASTTWASTPGTARSGTAPSPGTWCGSRRSGPRASRTDASADPLAGCPLTCPVGRSPLWITWALPRRRGRAPGTRNPGAPETRYGPSEPFRQPWTGAAQGSEIQTVFPPSAVGTTVSRPPYSWASDRMITMPRPLSCRTAAGSRWGHRG